jgi:hypothetical protein
MKLYILLATLLSTQTYAYLDGGMGGMLIQLLLGGAAGLLMTFKLYWKKWFGKKDQGSSEPSDHASNDTGH